MIELIKDPASMTLRKPSAFLFLLHSGHIIDAYLTSAYTLVRIRFGGCTSDMRQSLSEIGDKKLMGVEKDDC